MHITAAIVHSGGRNEVKVATNDAAKTLHLPAKETGRGSAVNGGELLLLALATCFCNDMYREAAKRNLELHAVSVAVSGEFGSEGEPGSDFHYTVNVEAGADTEAIRELVAYVDKIAEVHNTLRKGTPVVLRQNQTPAA